VTEDVSPDADLRSLGGRKLLFSEAEQAIYEVDEVAAFVWQSLRSGMSAVAIAKELTAAGVAEDSAMQAVKQAIAQLPARPDRQQGKAASSKFEPSNEAVPLDGLVAVTFEIPNASTVDVRLSDDLIPGVLGGLGYLQTDNAHGDCLIVARTIGETIEFYPPDKAMWRCDPADFVATLKADILEQVLRLASYEVALHTAALIQNGKALLIGGQPGAGKSTLALALTRAGWELAADDVALVNQRGLITGLPFPLTAKSSSWPLVDRHWPELAALPTYHRPDGFDVRYIIPENVASPGPWEVGAFVLLDRHPNAPVQVEAMDPADMLGTLISEATSPDQRLTAKGFSALVTSLEKAQCVKLTYSDLFEGVEALNELCV
jgi:hypothetical protein